MIELLGMSQPAETNVMKHSGFFLASVQVCVQFHIDVLLILQHLWNNSCLIGITWVSGLSTLKVTLPGAVHPGQRLCLCGRGLEQVCSSVRSCTEPSGAQLYRHFPLCLSLYSASNIALQSTLASNVISILW